MKEMFSTVCCSLRVREVEENKILLSIIKEIIQIPTAPPTTEPNICEGGEGDTRDTYKGLTFAQQF